MAYHYLHMRRKRGVTLLEMLIVCAVLSIGLVGTVSVISSSRHTQKEARVLAQLSLRANAELETWRIKSPDSLKTGTFPITIMDDDHTTGIVSIKPFQDTKLWEITVTLQRTTPKGTRKVIFNTLREVKP